MFKYLLFTLFLFLSAVYYSFNFTPTDSHTLFLSISTFLFATFSGFFIARQGRRYNAIRNQIAVFDGMMSSLYRNFEYFGSKHTDSIKKIIKAHYTKIIKNKAWDYHFVNKSSTIIDINKLNRAIDRNKASIAEAAVIRENLRIARDLQIARKKMVVLYQERIPHFQWFLIAFLAFILLLTVSLIPSQAQLTSSILKGAFGTCVILVIVLLRQFDTLHFFEDVVGEHSAQDILGILLGKK
ncbi:hypothetical protein HOB10_00985 [Candidatus Parcubacteria bacterium]|jgi:hypothetical protein|nr:hypothetical protein [Candidatus Parcubacteria bacterium]